MYSRIVAPLCRLFERLGSVPSPIFALLYFALLPIFAGIYYYLPGHFYHSTVQYESALNADTERILQELTDAIQSHVRSRQSNGVVEWGPWTYPLGKSQHAG